jgi:hypothetical protein
MAKKLTRDELGALLEQARQSFPHDECLTCECFLGYLAQLGMDVGKEVTACSVRWASTTSMHMAAWAAIPAHRQTCTLSI